MVKHELTGPLLPFSQISPRTGIRVERRLPSLGEILVQVGQQVEAMQKVGRSSARHEIRVLNIAKFLRLNDRADLSRLILKKCGDWVEAGEVLAARRGVIPLWHKPCRSPIAGRLVAIGYGWAAIEEEAESVDLLAFISGHVTATANRRSVMIETIGAHIVGAFGVGGEGIGPLQMGVTDRADTLSPDNIVPNARNTILVGGASLSLEAIERAAEMGVKGIIVGSLSASLHDLIPTPLFPIVAIEGYGNIPMSAKVFTLLRHFEGRQASISGQMEGGWDNRYPAIIIPLSEEAKSESQIQSDKVYLEHAQISDQVRAVRQPWQGRAGEIVSILAEPCPVPSGLALPGARIAFADQEQPISQDISISGKDLCAAIESTRLTKGSLPFVPWLNLERIG